jgi:capsular exopolysaccharide synthesis family protein
MKTQTLIQTRNFTNLPALAEETAARPEYSAEPQTGSLLDYWDAIRRRKLVLTVCAVVGLGMGIAVAISQIPMYRASTSIELEDGKGDDLAAKILNPQPDSTAVDPSSDIQTQIKILQSNSLIDRALNKAHISSLAELDRRSSQKSSWLKLFPKLKPEENRDALIEKVAKRLKVSAVNSTRIVEVSYEATDPAVAAQFANTLTSEFIQQSLEARWETNRKTSDWLVSQVNEMRGKLQSSEDALQAYARQKGLIYTGDKQNISEEKLRELQSELSKAQADRVEKQSRFEVAQGATPESIPEVLNDNNLRGMENNLVDLRKQEAEMAVTFKPDYTQAKRLRAEIDSLTSNIERKRTVIVSRLDNELQESQRRERLLGAAYAVQSRLVTNDSEKSIQYDMLKHDVDTDRQIYEVMLQRVKESSITSALKAGNVVVIDPAKAPLRPYAPNLPMNATEGLLFGLMLGVAGVVIRSKADGCVQEPGDAGLLLGIPELGMIPAGDPVATRGSRMLALLSPRKEPKTQGMQLVSSPDTSSMVADSFRAVLASILFMAAGRRQRVLVVTSASPGEGKTTTASNLAVTLAKMGRKVLLIDGDIRSPKIHSTFGLENSTGLTTTLKQLALNETVTDTFIRATAVPNLHVLTSGPAIQAGADLLFSGFMPTLITRYRNEFDMVLIDTPPMLVMPDARVLARLADAVILVARAGQTARSAIQAAYRRFVEDRTPVLGVVLNGWNAKMSSLKYYADYKEPAPEYALVKVTPVRAYKS